ncbi:MAG: hypothetical protein M1828_001078 [Chrysothrix sp. TS-e1954]|nr:MAG: hypothetical protein M1828_001078 [Chrysothrix sp. TS-e1954]
MLPILSTARRLLRRNSTTLLILTFLTLLEITHHTLSTRTPLPQVPLDPPFSTTCNLPGTLPDDAKQPRENAAIVMLARNNDMDGAVQALESLEQHWNKWFNYPVVFLNDAEWSPEFIEKLSKIVSGEATFARVPDSMWGWPAHVDKARARGNWERMRRKGLPYVGVEGYHHMCRFYSGFFQDHPSLLKYRWFWRVEPDAKFTCDIPYDPFRQMRLHKKIYGYTLALWEVGSTSPSLYPTIAEYKAKHLSHLSSGSLWNSMKDASWAPWPIRKYLLSWLLHSRDAEGDPWNFCHWWSNFEIADLEFFRGKEYRRFFEYLDEAGGFYYERWGDAPVHSLAVALFAKPEQVHHFSDVGYEHAPFQNCPKDGGCRCECDAEKGKIPDTCLRRLREGVDPP